MSEAAFAAAAPLSVLEVDLDAVAENYLILKKKLKAGCDCAAVVKADAYGLGMDQVAQALYAQSCRHFFVAHPDEGVSLRETLPSGTLIYVLNGPCGMQAADFIAAGLIPVLNAPADIAHWMQAAQAVGKRLPAVLHFDTGMNRLGLSASMIADMTTDIFKTLDIRCVMSHLACADTPDHPKNAAQLALFRALTAALARPVPLSLANSSGIFLGPEYHFDLARPGCALYGISPRADGQNPMQNPVTLRARILQTRRIDRGETVGYGASYAASSPVKCATISVGYADGYLRSLSGRGVVFINGEKCPVIGRVSMDTIVVDISGLRTECRVGDFAEIMGRHQTADDIARQAGTIGYEILTSLGARYKRVYKAANLKA